MAKFDEFLNDEAKKKYREVEAVQNHYIWCCECRSFSLDALLMVEIFTRPVDFLAKLK